MSGSPSVWHVYIALLADGRFYTGMTHVRPEERARRHQAGWGGFFTQGVKVVRVLWFESHATSHAARKRERQIKGWTHAKKEALIRGDLAALKMLARTRPKP